MQKIIAQIAQEIRVDKRQVLAAVELLDGGDRVFYRPLLLGSEVSTV